MIFPAAGTLFPSGGAGGGGHVAECVVVVVRSHAAGRVEKLRDVPVAIVERVVGADGNTGRAPRLLLHHE